MLPPYGKLIRERRDRGDHPGIVFVYYTQYWYKAVVEDVCNSLMIRPADYAPGKYDLSILAGLLVILVVDSYPPDYFPVLMEIGRQAAPVYINPEVRDSQPHRELDELLFCYRDPGPDGRYQWPAGWSDELAADYKRRSDLFTDFFERQVAAGTAS